MNCSDMVGMRILLLLSIEALSLFIPLAKVLEWALRYEDYKNHLVDHSTMMLTVAGQVTQTKQIVAKRFNFRMCTPDLVITVSLNNLKSILHLLVIMCVC